MKSSPNRLRVARAELRITQDALARRARLTQTRISRIENGIEQPTEVEKVRLARSLEASVDELFPCEVAK